MDRRAVPAKKSEFALDKRARGAMTSVVYEFQQSQLARLQARAAQLECDDKSCFLGKRTCRIG